MTAKMTEKTTTRHFQHLYKAETSSGQSLSHLTTNGAGRNLDQ